MIRPALRARLMGWREVIAAAACFGVAVWIFSLGGWLFWPIGAVLALATGGWLVTAWRRRGLLRPVTAQGVVHIDEGRIRYFGATALGGDLALHDLREVRLLRLAGQPHWRLKSANEALLDSGAGRRGGGVDGCAGRLAGAVFGPSGHGVAARRAGAGGAKRVVARVVTAGPWRPSLSARG